jgi:hypothetical protein
MHIAVATGGTRDVAIICCYVSVNVLSDMLRGIGGEIPCCHGQQQCGVVVWICPQGEHVLLVPGFTLHAPVNYIM